MSLISSKMQNSYRFSNVERSPWQVDGHCSICDVRGPLTALCGSIILSLWYIHWRGEREVIDDYFHCLKKYVQLCCLFSLKQRRDWTKLVLHLIFFNSVDTLTLRAILEKTVSSLGEVEIGCVFLNSDLFQSGPDLSENIVNYRQYEELDNIQLHCRWHIFL